MAFLKEIEAIEFYESLSEDQREKVNKKFELKFPKEKTTEFPNHSLHIIKCYMAMDMFGKKILKG